MGSIEEWEGWSNELASLFPEDAETWPGANPEGAQESIIQACLVYLLSEHDALRQVREDLTALADEWESDATVGEFVADAEAGIRWTPRFYFAPKIRAILDSARVSAADTQPEGALNVIFDGPPSHESGRFVEAETDDGRSINAGQWTKRPDGLWALRITNLPTAGGKVDTAPEGMPRVERFGGKVVYDLPADRAPESGEGN